MEQNWSLSDATLALYQEFGQVCSMVWVLFLEVVNKKKHPG